MEGGMDKSIKADRLLIAALCAALAACASPEPVAYSGIASSSQLTRNLRDDSNRVPFRYSSEVDWRSYTRVIVDPVVVYLGKDHQFGDMSEKDKTELARYMQARFAEKLKARFMLASEPAPNSLRVRLTLTGASESTPVLGTLSRLDIAGGIYNGVQTVRGGEGTLTGSVIYAVEVYDASTDRLLSAYVSKQYPSPINIGATLGTLDAARAGIDKGADALVAQLK